MIETPLRDHRQVIIIDPVGLHLRHAAKLVTLAKSFTSDIGVVCRGNTANAKSILDLVTLVAECGTALEIVAHGPDAEEAVTALAGMIGAGLDCSVSRTVAA
jgi:phosphotransferase system HPr (HPr) family protein